MGRRKVNKKDIGLLVANKNCKICQQPLTANNILRHRVAVYDYTCRTCDAERQKKSDLLFKSAVMKEYGGKCACCNEDNIVFLTIDHIDGYGAKHRRRIFGKKQRGGIDFYRWLRKKNYPKDNYQILCFNCNFAKHVLGRCPHQDNK